jgi:hypothetical protein
VIGDRLVYSLQTAVVSAELWSVEGSTGSPSRLRVMKWTTALQGIGNRFAVVSSETLGGGVELLVTDGTSLGTRSIGGTRLQLSSLSRFAPERFVIGGQAWVSAEDPALGVEPHVIDVGAAYESSLAACGGEGRAASLNLDGALELGSRREFRVRSSAGSVGFLLLGLDPGRSIPFAAAGMCQLAVDPSIAFVSAPLALVAGQASMLLDVPDLALLDGVLLSAQAVIGGTDAALGFDLSNGLAMSIGR